MVEKPAYDLCSIYAGAYNFQAHSRVLFDDLSGFQLGQLSVVVCYKDNAPDLLMQRTEGLNSGQISCLGE